MEYSEYSYGICKHCGKETHLKHGGCKTCNQNPVNELLGMFK